MTNVTKMDGTVEQYDPAKLARSLKKAGAGQEIIENILNNVKKILYEDIPTSKLHAYVLKQYKKHQPVQSAKYNLKRALLELGQHGFAFEKFTSRILQNQGYNVQLNKTVQGTHVTHEIDVDATKQKEHLMVECKHHIHPWIGLDIKIALYVWARYLDVSKTYNSALLATNTIFSPQAIQYSKGVGLKLMGWKYPQGNSLQENIENYKLYPISILPGITRIMVDEFAKKDIVTLKDLIQKKQPLPFNKEKINKLKNQASQICGQISSS